MRSRNSKIARTTVSVLMSLLFLAAASPAATKPISAPDGLARDSKGNLYVANYGGIEILIYNPNYQQMKSITKSIAGPTGIAFDPSGNFYVTNINANTITEYSPTGAYLSNIADVPTPDAISIDGVGNMWVQLADTAIILFSPSLNSEMQIANASGLQVNYFLGVATHGSQWAIGTDQGFELCPIDYFILTASTYLNPVANLNGNALAFDAVGNLYVGNLNGTVDYYNVATQTSTPFATLTYPKGIVVDNSRGRVYISDFISSDVQVYSTSGTLLATIK